MVTRGCPTMLGAVSSTPARRPSCWSMVTASKCLSLAVSSGSPISFLAAVLHRAGQPVDPTTVFGGIGEDLGVPYCASNLVRRRRTPRRSTGSAHPRRRRRRVAASGGRAGAGGVRLAHFGSRESQRRRDAMIASNSGLLERELIKQQQMATEFSSALRQRGVDPDTAELAARVGIEVFRTAYRRWLRLSCSPIVRPRHHCPKSLSPRVSRLG